MKAVERKVNAACTLLPETDVKATHNFGFPGLEISLCRALYRDFMLGAGFLTSLQRQFVHDYMDTGLDLMDVDDPEPETQYLSQTAVPWYLPALNFLAGENQAYQEALLEVALPDDRDRTRLYLSQVHLGMAVITGPAGTGKTTVAAIFTLSLLTLLGFGYGSAPTHAAVSKFAERLDAVDEWVARKIGGEPDDIYNTSPKSNPSAPAPASTSAPNSEYTVAFLAADSVHASVLVNNIGLERHLIVRGFKISTEVQAFEALLQQPTLGDDAVRFISWKHRSRWHLAQSASFYLLLILGLPGAGRRLTPEDSHRLHDLRSLFATRGDLAGLRQYAAGHIQYSEYSTRQDVLHPEAVRSLLEDIIAAADIVLTTPDLACDGDIFETRKQGARWISIDEAGNMNRPDEVSVRGNTCLPCVLAGDYLQLPPPVIRAKDANDTGDTVVNRHAADAGMSSLVRAVTSGMPAYRLRTQLRMAKGMFDLAGLFIYGDVDWQYGPGSDINLPQHELGRLLERYVLEKFPEVKPSPEGTLSPVFLHTRSVVVTNKVTGAKCNPVQSTVALEFIKGFVQATGVEPSRIVIITPHACNAELLNAKLKNGTYACLSGMRPAQTIDSYQGREADIVVNVLVATRESGP